MSGIDVKIGPNGEAAIPEPMRDRLGILPGDTVRFRLEGEKIVLDPLGDGDLDLDAEMEKRFQS